MSYWQVDDSFLGHHKTVRALRSGAEALQMWCALRHYVAVNNTDGVIPDEDINDLPHAPKSPRKWLRVLVECGKPMGDGERGDGLVDPHAAGWRLHDYQDHGLSSTEILKRKEDARERKRRWKERQSGTHTEHVPNASRTTNERPPIPSHPIPSPSQEGTTPSGDAAAKDLTGSARGEAPAEQRQLPRLTNLQDSLKVPIGQRAELLEQNRHLAEWLQPNRWPEVAAIAQRLASASGGPMPVGSYSDNGVKAVVALYAAGLSQADIERAVDVVTGEDWWRSRRRGLSSLSLEVVRRALAPAPDPESEARLRAPDRESSADAQSRRLHERVERLEAEEREQAAAGAAPLLTARHQ